MKNFVRNIKDKETNGNITQIFNLIIHTFQLYKHWRTTELNWVYQTDSKFNAGWLGGLSGPADAPFPLPFLSLSSSFRSTRRPPNLVRLLASGFPPSTVSCRAFPLIPLSISHLFPTQSFTSPLYLPFFFHFFIPFSPTFSNSCLQICSFHFSFSSFLHFFVGFWASGSIDFFWVFLFSSVFCVVSLGFLVSHFR